MMKIKILTFFTAAVLLLFESRGTELAARYSNVPAQPSRHQLLVSRPRDQQIRIATVKLFYVYLQL
jgi:hypothetical protein